MNSRPSAVTCDPCRSPDSAAGSCRAGDHVRPSSSEVIIQEFQLRLFSRSRHSNCRPLGERISHGSHGTQPGMSSTISQGLVQLNPPSVEKLCATTFDRFSRVSPGRRMLVIPNNRLPPSTGWIVQNGITQVKPLDCMGVQVRPPSSLWDWCMVPSGPCPPKTTSRAEPSGPTSR